VGTEVVLAKRAQQQLALVPPQVRRKLQAWALLVSTEGLRHARQISGFHDEPLRGDRDGQRSIRLSRAYRAFYVVTSEGEVEVVTVLEVNKHDY
jgi:proteic killer suppression protein